MKCFDYFSGPSCTALLENIADQVNDKKIEGVTDLRDESDRTGIRIVIELKREANPELVMNMLWTKTGLETSFGGNLLALVSGGSQPQRVTLRSALKEFLEFRLVRVLLLLKCIL